MFFGLSYFQAFAVHPVLQILASGLAGGALWLGIRRVRSAHFRQKVIFPWRRHVFFGTLALVMILAGAFAATLLMRKTFAVNGLTGLHWYGALLITPLALFGLGSGLVMDRMKQKRTRLNIAHGLVNAVVFCLVLAQVATGVRLVLVYLFGR